MQTSPTINRSLRLLYVANIIGAGIPGAITVFTPPLGADLFVHARARPNGDEYSRMLLAVGQFVLHPGFAQPPGVFGRLSFASPVQVNLVGWLRRTSGSKWQPGCYLLKQFLHNRSCPVFIIYTVSLPA